MRPLPCFAWLSPLLLALVTTLLVAPLLAPRLARSGPLAASAARPARSAYRPLLRVSAFPCLLLGALGLAWYRRRQRPRHWHPRVGLLSAVRVLPSGELSQPVSRYSWPHARRATHPRLS